MSAVSSSSYMFEALSDLLMPMWMEICFVLFFPVGWMLVSRVTAHFGLRPSSKPAIKRPSIPGLPQAQADKAHIAIKEDVLAGNMDKAVRGWRACQAEVPTGAETLRLVVKALAAVSPETVVKEISQHLDHHARAIRDTKSAAAILDALSTMNAPQLMEEMHSELHGRMGIYMTSQTYEALLAGHAAAGDKARVDQLVAELARSSQKLTARAHALVVKGFLCQGMLDAGLGQARAMLKQGYYVPSYAITQLIKAASEVDRTEEIFSTVLAHMELPAEAVAYVFEDCAKRHNATLAQKVEQLVRSSNQGGLPQMVYASLLKVLVVTADPRATELLKEMQKMNVSMNEAFFTSIISRCVESKFLCFAQLLADHLRETGGMTLAVYTVLAKVYAACGLHSQACDLYSELRERGLQPDASMASTFMKLAVKAGRTEITQALFDLHPQFDVQKYMMLIQAAGRDKDVDRAFAVFRKLEGSGLKLDSAVYNCVLDVCICAGDGKRAQSWLQTMREAGKLDIVGYNTMIKGCVSRGDIKGAQALFAQIEADGLKATDVTYNCVIFTAASSGNFQLAWEMVDLMQKNGTSIDQYTVGIIMRALKTQRGGARDVKRAMALLDRCTFDLCSDGVVLSLAIETAIKYRELDRVQYLVRTWEKSSLKPCSHTCAALVKAYSAMGRLERCRELWVQALRERGVDQNDVVLGCVLEAHVSHHQVDAAVEIFNEVKDRMPANMVLYSTLAKGYAVAGRAAEAMELWREIRRSGAKMNTVCYNVLIDGQARQGAMEEVSTLLAAMEPDGCAKDAITFCTVVKGHCIVGDLDNAVKIFQDMQTCGMALDCVVYNTLLDGCIQHGRMELADEILDQMETSKIKPSSFTMGIVVKLYGRRHQVEKAFAAIEDMKKRYGLAPNMQVFTCLMSACIANKDMERAVEVFNQMKAKVGVDCRAYTVLICGYLRSYRVNEAVAVVEEAYGLCTGKPVLGPKQYIAADCMQRLMLAVKQSGQQDTLGVPLLEKLRSAGVPLQLNVLTSALEGDRGAGAARRPGWKGAGRG